jgi:hypothetical protein
VTPRVAVGTEREERRSADVTAEQARLRGIANT